MKRRQYYKRTIRRHYDGELRGFHPSSFALLVSEPLRLK